MNCFFTFSIDCGVVYPKECNAVVGVRVDGIRKKQKNSFFKRINHEREEERETY
jgi:hypothetical protein